MSKVYKQKVEFHPRGGKSALARAYVAMLLRLGDAILVDMDKEVLPAVILMRMDTFQIPDSVELEMVCFDTVPELDDIHKFMGVKSEKMPAATLKLYECKASSYSPGSVIFAAADKKQVNELYAKEFPWRPLPLLIIEWQGSIAYGEPRLLYNGDEG